MTHKIAKLANIEEQQAHTFDRRSPRIDQELHSHMLLFNDHAIQSLISIRYLIVHMGHASTLLTPEVLDHFFKQRSWSAAVVLTAASVKTKYNPDGHVRDVK